MVNVREIRNKIKSIQSTQKITRAMEMVAASKMKRAQERMLMSRPYSQKISVVITHVAKGAREYQHAYTIKRKVLAVGFIVVTSDRGLSGGLNINVLKLLLKQVLLLESQNIKAYFFVLGKKAVGFLERLAYNITAKVTAIGDSPRLTDVYGLLHTALDSYNTHRVDELYLVYNEFINTMTQKPVSKKLVPILSGEDISNSGFQGGWDYIYEPDARELLDKLLLRYTESLFYQSIVENIASEQAARMVAMKSASDNASELISEFKLLYNKARQSSITQELSEIVSGADAV